MKARNFGKARPLLLGDFHIKGLTPVSAQKYQPLPFPSGTPGRGLL